MLTYFYGLAILIELLITSLYQIAGF